MNLDLTGQVAVVCGATQGIGFASAMSLAQMGARILLVARDSQRLEAAKSKLAAVSGGAHECLIADFSRIDEVKQAAADAVKRADTIQILVNNTGGPPGGLAIDAKLDEFTQAFNNHLLASQVMVQAIVPMMKRAHYGRIVNIISTSVKQPILGLGVSNTIRGAVASWSKTLSLELAAFGITVNNVLPGFTATGRLESLIQAKAAKQQRLIEEITEEMSREVPLGRFASPEEVAAGVAFLASPAASYISGVNLPVDGGRTSCL